MTIKWNNPKHNPVPHHYPCLMLLTSKRIEYGMFHAGLEVEAWTVLNQPEWQCVSKSGKVCGENHPKTTLSDDDCELIRDLYATGNFTYKILSEKFECSKSTIRDIIKYRTRTVVIKNKPVRMILE